MYFPDEFFEDEVRSGFFVDGLMKCCWAAQIEILGIVDQICKKHDIHYFAEWGTMLGTVRHGGFIPWDDDFDIGMKRADYEKFLEVANDELPEGFEVVNYHSHPDFNDVMTRIVNTMKIRVDDEFLDTFHSCPYICGLDIFPFDYLTRDEEKWKKFKEDALYVFNVAFAIGEIDMTPSELEGHIRRVEQLCNCRIIRGRTVKEQLFDIVAKMHASFSEEDSDQIAVMQTCLEVNAAVYPKQLYRDNVRMPFETTTIPVPVGYHEILKTKYKRYMRYVRRGGAHEYPFYGGQIERIVADGGSVSNYQYSEAKLQACKNFSFKKNQIARIEAVVSLQNKIPTLIAGRQVDVVFNILETCQTVAIEVGEAIEKRTGESSLCVTCLEQYCEALFKVAEMMELGTIGDGMQVVAILGELTDAVISELEAMKLKREVVLMPWKQSHWERLRNVWETLKEDPDVNVKVIPIPYQYKKRMGQVLTEERYEGDMFPADISVVHYQDYDVEKMHPDEIYIVTPFDNWGYTTTVPARFYASNLWAHTERLTYLPWFDPDEVHPEDERGKKSLKSLVLMPGVVWADRIFVASIGKKRNYVECLTEWAGEETKAIWEEKIHVWKETFVQSYKKKADSVRKLLYFVNTDSLITYAQQMIEKIRMSLVAFEQHSDKIHILWLQEAFLEENLKKYVPDVWAAYHDIMCDCEQKSYIRFVELSEGYDAVCEADAFYGDICRWELETIRQDKPVMLQSMEYVRGC